MMSFDPVSYAMGAKSGGGGGSGGGVLVVHSIYDEQTETEALDKTWQEIHDAALGQVLILSAEYEGVLEVYYLQRVSTDSGMTYEVAFAHNSNGGVDWLRYSASSASDYPVFYE